jgi:pimeloyl-ACP methyl ester carboxylesterase
MVAAEIAATNPERVDRLVLIAPVGLWLDDHPIPDFSGVPPERLPELLFADPTGPIAAMLPTPDPTDPEAMLTAAMTAASILQFIWPLPDKGMHKRLYRVKAPTLLVWGSEDALTHPAYGDAFRAAIAGSKLELIQGAGHIPQLEGAEATVAAVEAFLAN